jgi:hypothetical protein
MPSTSVVWVQAVLPEAPHRLFDGLSNKIGGYAVRHELCRPDMLAVTVLCHPGIKPDRDL